MSSIRRNTAPQRKRAATQKDVAERAGVSLSTVSYVLNNGPRPISEETRQRVLEAIAELDYHPNKYAQKLIGEKWESQQLKQFGVVLCAGVGMLTRPFYGAVLTGIYQEAYRQGLQVRFTQFLEDLRDPLLFNELVHTDEIFGLVMVSLNLSLAYWDTNPDIPVLLEKIQERVDNVVCVERGWDKWPAVMFDHAEAARVALRYLVSLGHRRIGYLGSPDQRLDGYRQIVFEHQLDTDPQLIAASAMYNSPEDGREGMIRLLKLKRRPTAVLTASDEVAIGALSALGQANLRVPDDISLISIDDIDLAQYTSPPLSTVRVPKASMGVHAVQTLLNNAARPSDTPVLQVMPVELVVRESCAPPA